MKLMDDFLIVIPVAIDNEKRKRNLEYVKQYYKDYNLCIVSVESSDYFHKAKICNDVYKRHKDKIIFMCDVDCLVPLENLNAAYDKLKQQPKTIVYPFKEVRYIDPIEFHSLFDEYSRYEIIKIVNGFSKDFTLLQLMNYILEANDCKINLDYNFYDNGYIGPLGFGFIFSCAEYYTIGLDNEYMLDYNFEDLERFERARNMGFDILHLDTIAYHMDHSNSKDWGAKVRQNKSFIKQNAFEFLKIINLNKKELKDYIEKWPWITRS